MMKQTGFILAALLAVTVQTARAIAEPSWDKAGECFNSGDFECAYSEAVDLYFANRVATGSEEWTTDSMTFLQMAYVEAAARATPVELAGLSGRIAFHMTLQSGRLPFVYGFNLLAMADACSRYGKDCAVRFHRAFCAVAKPEIPDPKWRQLDDTNQLSDVGTSYFDRIWRSRPACVGA